jgi:hypothetical protein
VGESAREVLLGRLPDEPRWVDFRGLLGREATRVLGGEGGWALVAPWIPLVACVGDPGAAVLEAALADGGRPPVLCGEDVASELEARLPGWRRSGVTLFTRDAACPLPSPGRARLLVPGEEGLLRHVPEALRAELAAALERSPVAAAFEGDRPVSFCYAHHVTERYWDASVDTLEGHRRRGHAVRAASFLVRHLRLQGLDPVWGAEDDNAGSIGTARRLGFVPSARLVLLHPSGRGAIRP